MENSKTEKKHSFSDVLGEYSRYIGYYVNLFPQRYREDLYQEGLLGLYSACLAYGEREAPFAAYARACIKNGITTAYKRMSKDKEVLAIDETYEVSDSAAEDAFFAAELRGYFEVLRIGLSETERKVLDAYLDDRSYEQIAAETGLTVKKVDNALVKIRKQIKRTYN